MQIKDYLYGKKLHPPLGKKLETMSQDDWNILDRQVLDVIRLTISKNIPHNVAKENSPEGLMKVLSDIYKKPSTNNTVIYHEETMSIEHGRWYSCCIGMTKI
ncbi:hypothetical protein AtEden1_Chr3g0191071 [Arabidopsis thaliana]